MKWILAILLLISASAIGQVDDTTKYISYPYQYGMKMPRMWAPTTMIMPSGDTTGRRPGKIGAFMMCTCDGNVYRWDGTNWVSFGAPQRFGLEDNLATGARTFNANGNSFNIDSVSNYNVYSKAKTSGSDRGVITNFGFNTNNSINLWSYIPGSSTRSYGFNAYGALTQMFAAGHVPGNSGYVQADTTQIILESDPNRLYVRHDSVTITNFNNATLDFRLRPLPSTIDTSYKSLVSGPNGQVFLRPGDAGSGGASVSAGRWLTKANDSIYLDIINKRVPWFGIRTANAFGDSYTTYDALNNWRKSWIHIVRDALGFTLNNYAVSGTGAYQTSANANRYIDPSTNAAASFVYIGLNDARRGAIADKMFTKFEEGVRTTVVQNLLDSVFYSADASVTQGGTWASRSLTTLGGKAGWYGTNGLLSTGTSNTLTKQITGDKIAIGYIGVDGAHMTGSSFTVDITTPAGGTISRTIDPNNRTDGISDGINSNASLSCVAYFTGLGDTTHTVTITTLGSDSVYIDYIANLRDAQNVPPVIIQQVPYLNQDGYGYIADPGLNYDNNARTDSMNNVLRTVVGQFTEFPVTLVRTNSYIDTTMLLSDDIHYDSVAQYNISVGTLQNISTSYTASTTAAGATGDLQFKGASGSFDAESNLNYDKAANLLSLGAGQLSIGGTPFGSSYKIALTSSGGADNTMVMESKGNDNNSNGFYNIKSKAGNYNLGAGVKIGYTSFNTVMEYGVISNSLTDGGGFSLGDFYYSASGSELMRLNSGGALLIGRNAPLTTEKLRVNGDAYFESNAGNTLISLGGANAAVSTYSAWVKNTGGNTVVSFANYDNNTNYPQLYLEKKRGGSYNVTVGDIVGDVSFTNFSGVKGVANSITDGSFRGSDIVFYGADNALSVDERMRMTGPGNLMIGTSSDNGSKLQVNGDATVADEAYDATAWNGSLEVPTKNALRDKLEGMITSLNSQTGAVTITAGTAITTSTLSGDITIGYDRTNSSVPHTLATYLTDVNNSGTTETDLYNTTVPANKLLNNGQSIHFIGTVFMSDINTTTQIRVYFAGTEVANTGGIAISGTGYIKISGELIRTTSTTARASFKVEGNGLTTDYVNELDLTGLDFTTGNVFKVTGTAGGGGASSNDITAKSGKLTFQSN